VDVTTGKLQMLSADVAGADVQMFRVSRVKVRVGVSICSSICILLVADVLFYACRYGVAVRLWYTSVKTNTNCFFTSSHLHHLYWSKSPITILSQQYANNWYTVIMVVEKKYLKHSKRVESSIDRNFYYQQFSQTRVI